MVDQFRRTRLTIRKATHTKRIQQPISRRVSPPLGTVPTASRCSSFSRGFVAVSMFWALWHLRFAVVIDSLQLPPGLRRSRNDKMPVFATISGDEIDVDYDGHYLTSLKSLCDTRQPHDTASKLPPGKIAGLRFRWIVAVELQSEYGLSLSQIATVMQNHKGTVSRMLAKTRELLQDGLSIET